MRTATCGNANINGGRSIKRSAAPMVRRNGVRSFMILCVLFFSAGKGFSQTSFLQAAQAKLETALVKKDTVTLKQLLHPDLSYGHSNGWVENKKEVIQDLTSGKLDYRSIRNDNVRWTISGHVATMRSATDLQYVLEGKEGSLKLHVVQVWVKSGRGWQLLVRQSTKI